MRTLATIIAAFALAVAATADTTTSTVYNIEWRVRPEYYPFAVTNVYTNIFVNGINQR